MEGKQIYSLPATNRPHVHYPQGTGQVAGPCIGLSVRLETSWEVWGFLKGSQSPGLRTRPTRSSCETNVMCD